MFGRLGSEPEHTARNRAWSQEFLSRLSSAGGGDASKRNNRPSPLLAKAASTSHARLDECATDTSSSASDATSETLSADRTSAELVEAPDGRLFVRPPPNIGLAEIAARARAQATGQDGSLGPLVASGASGFVDRRRKRGSRSQIFERDECSLDGHASPALMTIGDSALLSDSEHSGSLESSDAATASAAQRRKRGLVFADEHLRDLLLGGKLEGSWPAMEESLLCGISPSMRDQFWVFCALDETSGLMEPLHALLARAKLSEQTYAQVQKDLYRTLPELHSTQPVVIQCLYQLLVAFYTFRAPLEYTQGINYVAARIVQTVHSPQNWLPVMQHFVSTVLPFYYTTDMLGQIADGLVLECYMRERCPRLVKHIAQTLCGADSHDDFGAMMRHTTASQFTTAFARDMAPSALLKLWDMLFLVGAKALFEFWIKLCIYAYRYGWIDRCSNWPEFYLHLTERIAQFDASRHTFERVMAERVPHGALDPAQLAMRRRAAVASVARSVS